MFNLIFYYEDDKVEPYFEQSEDVEDLISTALLEWLDTDQIRCGIYDSETWERVVSIECGESREIAVVTYLETGRVRRFKCQVFLDTENGIWLDTEVTELGD